jgi:fermentation-respiration switch protein FrsA (DUF1100 family)
LRDDNIEIKEQFYFDAIKLMNNLTYEKHNIINEDHLKLSARYYKVDEAERIVLAVHGYKGFGIKDMGVYSEFLMKEKSNYFVIDHRSHNDSEGKYITMGSKEKYDVKEWIEYINTINPKNLPIYLISVSMGSATCLQTIGLELPNNVKGLIADCGFTSSKDIVKNQLKNQYNLNGELIIKTTNMLCKLVGKFNIYYSDTKQTLNTTNIPVLFIHGLKDDYVPSYMSEENYNRCNSKKELHLVKDADHCRSYLVEKENYENWIRKFFIETK